MITLDAIQRDYATELTTLSRLGYDLIGTPKQRGGATLLTFRKGDDDGYEVAVGELSFWVAELTQPRLLASVKTSGQLSLFGGL